MGKIDLYVTNPIPLASLRGEASEGRASEPPDSPRLANRRGEWREAQVC